MLRSRTITLTLLASIILISGGCESTQNNITASDALLEYNAGRYTQARIKAVQAMKDSTGMEREQAAYIAGLSAFKMGNFIEADRRLAVAAQSKDRTTAGRAKATLGLVRLEQKRPLSASDLLKEASKLLTGVEAKEAAKRAELAASMGGDRIYGSSQPNVVSSTGSNTVKSPPKSGFAIQVGAYQDRENAQQAAQNAIKIASRHNLGSVRIITRKDERSRILYIVQFGQFNTRTAAERIRKTIGQTRYIVAPVIIAG